ncbi:MAG TPA: hypothetical protein VFG71_13100, partial [Nitrospiraceae bacterium]|nr:hypothetical protein [Nitrospiraceae bacterium]
AELNMLDLNFQIKSTLAGGKMAHHHDLPTRKPEAELIEERRRFLADCGKFAVVTPPAITLLLSTSLNSSAIAQSGGRPGARGNNGYGNGGGDGSPNGKSDADR